MGHKVDMSEVLAFANDATTVTESVLDNLEVVQSAIELFHGMDSFQGKAAIAAKDYLQNVHETLIAAFEELFIMLNEQLHSHIETFHTQVDASREAVISSDYLRDHHRSMTNHYREIEAIASDVKGTLRKVADISSVTPPSIAEAEEGFVQATRDIEQLEEKLTMYTSYGSGDTTNAQRMLDEIEALIAKVNETSAEARFSELGRSAHPAVMALRDGVITTRRAKTFTEGMVTSFKMYQAAKDAGLDTEIIEIGGKKYYRVIASKEALERLGIKPDAQASRELMKRLPKGNKKWKPKHYQIAATNRANLKYAGPRKPGWSGTGKEVIKKYPEVSYYSKGASLADKSKIVGKAALKGAGDAFQDAFNFRDIARNGVVKGTGKALAPIGVGLNYYSNHHDAVDAGLSGKEAATRATVDTAIDTAVGGAVQAGSVALFTAAIPIPGVGTAVGVMFGVFANMALNTKFGKSNKSVMDRIKGWFH